jgi:hypothetical protein
MGSHSRGVYCGTLRAITHSAVPLALSFEVDSPRGRNGWPVAALSAFQSNSARWGRPLS